MSIFEWNFNSLVNTISHTEENLAKKTKQAVNISLTARNWLIGFYISDV